VSDDANGTPQPPAATTALKPWAKFGPSPNPAGRGHSPSKFSKAFLASVSAKWKAHGDDVLEEVGRDDPGLFLRVCASLIPQSLLVVTHSTTPAAQLSESDLQAILVEDVTQLERLRAALLPLIDRVAKNDPQLAQDMHRVLADG
jgi:hypothetical protein